MNTAKEILDNNVKHWSEIDEVSVLKAMEEYRNQPVSMQPEYFSTDGIQGTSTNKVEFKLLSGVPLDEEIRIESLVGYENNTAGSLNFQLGAKYMRDRLAPMISKLEEYKEKYGEL